MLAGALGQNQAAPTQPLNVQGAYNSILQGNQAANQANMANVNAQNQQNTNLWNTAGVLGAAAISDRRLKKLIRKVGKLKNGLNLYAWIYKWGEPGLGVMADEVEKLIPEAVIEFNGYKMVNYALL